MVTVLGVQNFLFFSESSRSPQKIILCSEQFFLALASAVALPLCPLLLPVPPSIQALQLSPTPLLCVFPFPALQAQSSAAPVFSGTGEEAASQVTPGVMERGGRERLVCVETVT